MYLMKNGKTREGRRGGMPGRVIAVVVLVSFFVTYILPQSLFAVIPDAFSWPAPTVKVYRDPINDLRDGVFEVPYSLGSIQDQFVGATDKVVIHIQDAHCNYYAQQKIKELIKYLKKKYGVTLICLEGGSGAYDLSPFTGIQDKDIRTGTVNYFAKQSNLNGAELAEIELPGEFLLWGLEDVELYRKDLNVYRGNEKYKREIREHIARLSFVLDDLKRLIYSDDLFRMDLKYSGYKSGNLSFKEYLSYLMEEAGLKAIPVRPLHNIYLLKQVLDAEDNIDFREANSERESYLEALRQKTSRNQRAELLEKTIAFRSGVMPGGEYYDYLLEKGKDVGIKMSNYPALRSYVRYVLMYAATDRSMVMKDMSRLEDLLRENMCVNDKQKELILLSRDFTLVKKAFDFSLTKDDFTYFKKQQKGGHIRNLLAFMRKHAPEYNIRARLPESAVELDERLMAIERFYVYSFERDSVFISNMKEKMESSGFYKSALVTGGFHTENLTELMRQEGVSYVSIVPNFKNKKGYQSPYFAMLGGKSSRLGGMVLAATTSASSNIQIASIWNRLGLEIDGELNKNLAMIQLEIVKKIFDGQEAFLKIENLKDTVIRFFLDDEEEIAYKIDRGKGDLTKVLADVRITNTSRFTYEDQEAIMTRQLKTAYNEGRVREVSEETLEVVAKFFDEVGKTRISRMIRDKSLRINRVSDIFGFRGYTNHGGVYVGADIDIKETPEVIVYEIGVRYGLSPKLAVRLERLYKSYRLGENTAMAVALADKDNLDILEQLADMNKPAAGREQGRKNVSSTEQDQDETTTDFLDENRNNVEIQKTRTVKPDKLKFTKSVVKDGKLFSEKHVVDIVSSSEQIPGEVLLAMETKDYNVPFVEKEALKKALKEFFSGWNVRTIEDNFFTAGFVDFKERIVYVTETIRSATDIAPEIIPMIILREFSRYDETQSDRTGEFRLKMDPGIPFKDIDTALFVRGLSSKTRKDLQKMFDGITSGSGEVNWARMKVLPVVENGSEQENYLLRANFNAIKLSGTRENGAAFGYGIIDYFAGGEDKLTALVSAVTDLSGTDQSVARLVDALFKLRPGVKFGFADIMAGRARKDALGGKIMDKVRAEATEKILRLARRKGIFAYHYGSDEHGFIFPEKYSNRDINRFYLDMTSEMKKLTTSRGSKYVLYTIESAEIPKDIQGIIDDLKGANKELTVEVVGERTHILVSKELQSKNGRLKNVLEDNNASVKKMPQFVLPMGVIGATNGSVVPGSLMRGISEAIAGQKYHKREGRSKYDRKGFKREVWDKLSPGQQKWVWEKAVPRLTKEQYARFELNKKNDKHGYFKKMPSEKIVSQVLSGLNKDAIRIVEKEIEKPTKVKIEEGYILSDNGKKELIGERGKNRKGMVERIDERLAVAGEKTGGYGADAYTGYDSDVLLPLLTGIMRMSPDEKKKLSAEERIFMIRGPPIDVYMVVINEDGRVYVINVDAMFHAEGKKNVEDMLRKGISGRQTDYLVVDERTSKKQQVFPFKAVNSYFEEHQIADEYILAMFGEVYDVFTKVMEEEKFGGKGNITDGGIEEAVKETAQKINGLFMDEKFRKIGKEPIRVMLETHVVRVDKGGKLDEKPNMMPKEIINDLRSMGAVRDPEVVRNDGAVVFSAGQNGGNDLAGRIRTYDPEKKGFVEKYEDAYRTQQERDRIKGDKELERKTSFFLAGIENIKKELGQFEMRDRVSRQYAAAKGVISDAGNVNAPLIVFIQCDLAKRSLQTKVTRNVLREISRKYGVSISNISVRFYKDKTDLEQMANGSAVRKMLSDENGRAVVFCNKGFGVHPKGDKKKDIFAGYKVGKGNAKGDPKVYYIEEQFRGIQKKEIPDPLIGPHVALAIGIRELKRLESPSSALLQELEWLLEAITGRDIYEDISAMLTRLLNGDTLQISKIDFETLRDQIAAEEAALVSL